MDIDGAREKYLDYLGQALSRHDARMVAYCLMSSHVHLVVQLGCDPLGKLTTRIHSPFGNWVNSQKQGVGAIFADRPKSVLVHTETHGMELIRYVHNNPVRAGVVERASESGWSSHRAYLGLKRAPEWLSTEAVLGPDEKEHESIRHELGCFVNEGRKEKRRPEFSGEVSPALTRRIRKLMGGEVALSYPVLGPDDFVLSAMKEQVERHSGQKMSGGTDGGVESVIKEVFTILKLDPRSATQRIRPRDVARARALSAWLWVERMGRPQMMVADGLRVSTSAVGKMLRRLREEGPTKAEEVLLNKALKKLTSTSRGEANNAKKNQRKTAKPNVIMLKRKR